MKINEDKQQNNLKQKIENNRFKNKINDIYSFLILFIYKNDNFSLFCNIIKI